MQLPEGLLLRPPGILEGRRRGTELRSRALVGLACPFWLASLGATVLIRCSPPTLRLLQPPAPRVAPAWLLISEDAGTEGTH